MPLRPLAIGFVVVCLTIVMLSLVGAIRGIRARKWLALLLVVPALLCGYLAWLPVPYLLGLDQPHAFFNSPAPVPADEVLDYLTTLTTSGHVSSPAQVMSGVQASTGKTLWHSDIANGTAQIVVGSGKVVSAAIAQGSTQLSALDSNSGTALWQGSLPIGFSSAALQPEAGLMVVGGFAGNDKSALELVGVRVSDSARQWSVPVAPYDAYTSSLRVVSSPSASVFYDVVDGYVLEARRMTDGALLGIIPRINGAALAAVDTIFDVPSFASTGSLRAYRLSSLTSPSPLPVWEFGANDAFHSAVVSGDTLFVTAQHYGSVTDESGKLSNPETLYALDARTGAVRWHFATQSAGAGTLATNGDTIYIQADDGISALHRSDGARIWHMPANGWRFAAYQPTLGSVVYFMGTQQIPPETLSWLQPTEVQGFLYAVNASSGELYWGQPVGPVITIPAFHIVY